MLELAALGLLQKESLNGYRLKQQLELFMSGCISVNYGAIYPLLKRLEKQGAIQIQGESGASRKIYSITEKGRQLWKQMMLEHPHESWVHSRSRFIIKYFFFGYLDVEERLKLLEYRRLVCQLRLDKRDWEILSLDSYQAIAWQKCRQSTEDEIQWLNEQINHEKTLIPNFATIQ